MTERAAVILAAGQGTRMRSPTPKVLHRVGGRRLLDRAIDAAEGLGCARIVVVAGAHSPEVAAHAKARLGADAVAIQDPPLGTGHAVRAAEAALKGFAGDVVILYADTPLLDAEAVAPLFEARARGADLAVLGFEAVDPAPYGRLVQDHDGSLLKIVEAKDASPEELLIAASNSGVLAAPAPLLFELLSQVTNQNAKGEYYLTDVVGLARGRGLKVAVIFASEARVMGVNSQVELAIAEAEYQRGRRKALMDAGVSMIAPETVFLSWDTEIAPGAVIEPNVVFSEKVVVESGAVIRSFCHLEGAHVRAGVKKAAIGKGAKVNHLAYLGDGSVGAGANIGAGTIFCNYDGFDKHFTEVGEGAFIGSNSALVAPVKIGAGAYIGSGSVITRNVDADSLALERATQVEKPGWAAKFRGLKRAAKNK